MSKLVISLATRGRPQQLIDTISKSFVNWRSDTTVMMVQVDADDQATINHLGQVAPHCWFVGPNGPRVIIDVRPREDTIAAKWNRAMSVPADVYLVAADDDPYITPGYDAKILEAAALFDDGIGMVYGHMANLSFSCAVAPTAKWVEKLGFIQPDYFPYWFCDHWTDDLARITGRISFADVKTDQSKAGLTQEMREPAWWATWFDAGYLMRRRQAWDLIQWSSETLNTKNRLYSNAPRVEYYSRGINDTVRAQAAQLAARAPLSLQDERYQRVKAKAVAMLPAMLDGMDQNEAIAFTQALVPQTTIQNIGQAYRRVA